MFRWVRDLRRKKVAERPFPEAWRKVLEKNVTLVRSLSPEDRAELEADIQIFLSEKNFEGAGGFEITDEVRVTIAGQACLLLLHRNTDYYPGLESIVVYPSAYVARAKRIEGGVVQEGDEARLGESWGQGTVALAWNGVVTGGRNREDGHNVVLHEFAHQLDQEDGEADGAPILATLSMYAPWAAVLSNEFAELVASKYSDIDRYGATNPAEFFAVITEAFFEKPLQLKRKHPELYAQLAAYYQQDPASRV